MICFFLDKVKFTPGCCKIVTANSAICYFGATHFFEEMRLSMEKQILFCNNGGCTAKLGPAVLSKILEKIPKTNDENLLVGYDSNDDASIYKLTDELAIVQTLDFFPPMVEDPYTFGQIAAANALSDVYAMGGDVKTALNIVCYPESLDLNILGEILMGGADKVAEASGVLSGGHSIADSSVKYGLSVTGIVHPDKILKNNTPEIGDVLILTKPLGVGLITTANRVGEASKDAMKKAIHSMTTLNKYAAEIMKNYDVHACTDITGFSFLGHLHEMLNNTYSATIYSDRLPIIEDAVNYAEEFLISAAGQRNRNFLSPFVNFRINDFAIEEILYDAQTSGGLLYSIKKEDAQHALEALQKLDMPCGIVGEITNKKNIEIEIQ